MLLYATIQQIPTDDTGSHELDREELQVHGEDCDAALSAAEAQVPDGWRFITRRVDRAPERGTRE